MRCLILSCLFLALGGLAAADAEPEPPKAEEKLAAVLKATGIELSRPDEAKQQELGIADWDTWSHDAGDLPWTYDQKESCFILEGKVTVETDKGSVDIGPGDFIVLPKGLKCVWHIKEAVRKHYQFESE